MNSSMKLKMEGNKQDIISTFSSNPYEPPKDIFEVESTRYSLLEDAVKNVITGSIAGFTISLAPTLIVGGLRMIERYSSGAEVDTVSLYVVGALAGASIGALAGFGLTVYNSLTRSRVNNEKQ